MTTEDLELSKFLTGFVFNWTFPRHFESQILNDFTRFDLKIIKKQAVTKAKFNKGNFLIMNSLQVISPAKSLILLFDILEIL